MKCLRQYQISFTDKVLFPREGVIAMIFTIVVYVFNICIWQGITIYTLFHFISHDIFGNREIMWKVIVCFPFPFFIGFYFWCYQNFAPVICFEVCTKLSKNCSACHFSGQMLGQGLKSMISLKTTQNCVKKIFFI